MRRLTLVLAGLALVLGACSSDSAGSEDAAISAELQQVLDDYIVAWEQHDVEAFQAIVTEDFVLTESFYAQPGDSVVQDSFDLAAPSTAREIEFGYDFEVEHFGKPIATGDRPWFISVGETWTAANEEYIADGVASYTIVDVDGTLKVASHYWVGNRSTIED